MPMAPDLNLLPALDALLSEASVTRAAERLQLSESAMSRTLARLRAATGDPLLVRAGRAMVLTPHALALREQVQALARDASAVLQPAGEDWNLATLERTFTLRANDGFIEAFAPALVARAAREAPGVRLRFAPKPDKDVRPLREGLIDLDLGVLGPATGPEVRVQAIYRDHFVGAVRPGHPLLQDGPLTPERYAACGHIVASRRGHGAGPVDDALAERGLSRTVAAMVPSFRAALSIAAVTDLVALVPASFFARQEALVSFALPVNTEPIVISQMWHPRLERDPGHRWLRGLVLAVCREAPPPSNC
ncbi:LysR family transcriptional regulator [Ideonella dechloratans]|uniref:LysR family transcriptional regulator n=1 Tax=Ideonella dechloratans TaxID=36863 RepID=UPI0035AE00F0